MTDLADYTTLGLGGPAKTFVAASAEADIIDAVRAADAAGEPVLVLGGGSNLVVADDGFPGTVIFVGNRGIGYTVAAGGQVDVTVAAGEDWDDVVAAVVAEELAGLECLSGIPGRAGATPIQNVGAYGEEVSDTIAGVRAFDRDASAFVDLEPSACGFGYRASVFKGLSRWIVTRVRFSFERGTAYTAITKIEIRGAHYRTDYPEKSDSFALHSLIQKDSPAVTFR